MKMEYEVATRVAGRVTQILVHEGDEVLDGDLLMAIRPT